MLETARRPGGKGFATPPKALGKLGNAWTEVVVTVTRLHGRRGMLLIPILLRVSETGLFPFGT